MPALRKRNLVMDYKERIKYLLAHPEELIRKKPFRRGIEPYSMSDVMDSSDLNAMVRASIPSVKQRNVSQIEFLQELDPNCHKVLFDQNIPSITMKLNDGGMVEIEYKRMSVAFQKNILDKQVLHLCGNRTEITLASPNPSEKDIENYIFFKRKWAERNQDGMRTKMVRTQKSVGDAGLLFYMDYKGRIKSRILSFEDGYVLCPHNDENGDRILEAVYYRKDNVEIIDCYDDTYFYRLKRDSENTENTGWQYEDPRPHGFSEIPLVTKRGKVAWDNVQSIIDVYEVIYNIFLVVQKRHGWGILYVKGKFADEGKKIAGAIVLNDRSIDGKGSAEFKQAPTPQGMIETLQLMEETIQKGSGTTFLLPKDIKATGDISAQAILLTQSLDNETALQGAIDYQNVIDKMVRLFKEGLAKELVLSKKNKYAITEFEGLEITGAIRPWNPQNKTDYNSMLIQLKGAGLISEETAIEKNTESTPDEKVRRSKEKEEERKNQASQTQNQSQNQINQPIINE